MSRSHAILAVLLVFIASARIVSTYTVLSHTMDEPGHLGCGMQWLNGAYTWDTEHPPIARVMAAVAVSLAGERLTPADGSHLEGSLILGHGDHYDRILSIARFGVLPLFWIASLAVFLWAKRAGGPMAAVIATFLFTTTPPVLAHAGLVTTDMACTAFGALAFLASLWWADHPDRARTVLFGIALGLAAAAKFSLLAYLPAAWLVLLAIHHPSISTVRRYLAPLAVAGLMGAIVICAAYRFTLLSEFFAGIQCLIKHNSAGHSSYLLGQRRHTGVWYYFPVVLSVKTPIAMLLLLAGGLVTGWRKRLPLSAPVAFAAGILLVAMMSRINIGVRHVLPIYTAFSVIGAVTAAEVMRGTSRRAAGILLLLGLQAISGVAQHPDYIAYTNEFVSGHPEDVTAESDLDWGQDMKLVAAFLARHGAARVAFTPYCATYLSAGRAFPPTTPTDWYHPSPGWNVVSLSGLKVFDHPGWAEKIPPHFKIGKTHWAYYFP
jgi:4-amino-4-deoxy-L-arabinose transferase-like glycosyltransferase